MSNDNVKELKEIKVDAHNFYREENFTDLKIASIRRLTPVKADGSNDDTRAPIFIGQAHMMTAAGPVPIQCPLEARTLEEATQKFPEAIKKAVDTLVDEVKELKRKEESKIIVPGEDKGKITLS